MSFQARNKDTAGKITSLKWKLYHDSSSTNSPCIARIKVNVPDSSSVDSSIKNPLHGTAASSRLVRDYGNGEKFIPSLTNTQQNVDLQALSLALSSRVFSSVKNSTGSQGLTKQTPGNQLISDNLNSFAAFLLDGTKSKAIDQAINASTSSLLLKNNDMDTSQNLLSNKNNDTAIATSLFQSSLKKCSRDGKGDCFIQARDKISDLGALLLRNLFAYLCQDEDFVRQSITDYTIDENLKCAIWRVCMTLENMADVAKALDDSLLTTSSVNNYYQQAFQNLGNPAVWVFIVTAYRSPGGRIKLFISFVDDGNAEYSQNIAPLFSFVEGTFFVSYLRPSNDSSQYQDSNMSSRRRRFIGGTPFTVPSKQTFLGSVTLAPYASKAQRPKVRSSFSEVTWKRGSKVFRKAAMQHWVTLVKNAGFHSVKDLQHMSAHDIHKQLHKHIVNSEGECRYPLCSDTLMVLGFAGSAEFAPSTSEITVMILRDLLSYFIGQKKDLAEYFFELVDDEDDDNDNNDRESQVLTMKNPSSIPFTNMLLVDVMIATHIFLCKAQLVFSSHEVEGQVIKIFGAQTQDPQALIRAHAATLSMPTVDVDVTSQEDLVMMIRTYDESVLAPVAGYVDTRGDHRLRKQLDMLRVELYRMGFSDTVGGSSSGINKRAQVLERETFFSLLVPDIFEKRAYSAMSLSSTSSQHNSHKRLKHSRLLFQRRPGFFGGPSLFDSSDSDSDGDDDDDNDFELDEDEDLDEQKQPSSISESTVHDNGHQSQHRNNNAYSNPGDSSFTAESHSSFPDQYVGKIPLDHSRESQETLNPNYSQSFVAPKPKGSSRTVRFRRQDTGAKSREPPFFFVGSENLNSGQQSKTGSAWLRGLVSGNENDTDKLVDFIYTLKNSLFPFYELSYDQENTQHIGNVIGECSNDNISTLIPCIRTRHILKKVDEIPKYKNKIISFLKNIMSSGSCPDAHKYIIERIINLIEIVADVNAKPPMTNDDFLIVFNKLLSFAQSIDSQQYKFNSELTKAFESLMQEDITKHIRHKSNTSLMALMVSIRRNKFLEFSFNKNLINPTTDYFDATRLRLAKNVSYDWFQISQKQLVFFIMQFKDPFFFPIATNKIQIKPFDFSKNTNINQDSPNNKYLEDIFCLNNPKSGDMGLFRYVLYTIIAVKNDIFKTNFLQSNETKLYQNIILKKTFVIDNYHSCMKDSFKKDLQKNINDKKLYQNNTKCLTQIINTFIDIVLDQPSSSQQRFGFIFGANKSLDNVIFTSLFKKIDEIIYLFDAEIWHETMKNNDFYLAFEEVIRDGDFCKYVKSIRGSTYEQSIEVFQKWFNNNVTFNTNHLQFLAQGKILDYQFFPVDNDLKDIFSSLGI